MFDVIVVDFRLGYYCIRYRVHALLHGNLRKGAHGSRVTTRAGARRAARAARARSETWGPARHETRH